MEQRDNGTQRTGNRRKMNSEPAKGSPWGPPSTVSVKNSFIFNHLAGANQDKFLCFNDLRPES